MRGVKTLTRGEELLSLQFYGVLLNPPTRESRVVIPSPKLKIEMVPSPEAEERSTEGEDVFDSVSIPESLFVYSLEVEVSSIRATLEGGEGDEAMSGV